jgi:aminomethyltransferase
MPYYTAKYAEMKDVGLVLISTTGYTGAGGYEIYVPNPVAEKAWHAVFEGRGSVRDQTGRPCRPRHTCVLEMGFCLYGNDIDDTTSPIEAGLGWITKFTKDFIDSETLKAQKDQGTARKLVAFELLDRGIPRHDHAVLDASGNVVGKVTSGTQSPSLQRPIGMAYVPIGMSAEGSDLWVDIRGKALKGRVVKLPFYKQV